jgi:hypothetical protein
MGLGRLFLRHSSRSFLFFEEGQKLLSVKWVSSSNSSSGKYEFIECVLGNFVKVLSKNSVDWSFYEKSLDEWLLENKGFVFDQDKVFSLVWNFFVVRNDVLLAERYDPFLIHSTLSADQVSLAKKIASEFSSFWGGKPGDILKNYAYWLDGYQITRYNEREAKNENDQTKMDV